MGPSIAIQWMPACFLLGEQCGDGLWGHQQGAARPASPRTLSWRVGRGPQEFLLRGETDATALGPLLLTLWDVQAGTPTRHWKHETSVALSVQKAS